MPARWWRHACSCGEPDGTEERCPGCGGFGEDLGWRMSEEDRDQAFRWGTGLVRPAEGDDSARARSIRERLVPCGLCDQTGLIQTAGAKDGWDWCPRCHGMGGALDGHFVLEPPGADIAASIAPRLCSTGYIHHYGPGRRIRRDLDCGELTQLRQRLVNHGFRHRVPVVPAILCAGTGRLAVGPTYRAMLEPGGGLRALFALTQVRRGYIDLEDGRFLDRERAVWRARTPGLPSESVVLLHPERLPYHADVPCGLVRWEATVVEE